MKPLLTFIYTLLFFSLTAQTTIFHQDFSSSSTVSDYVGSPPSANQFDFITVGSGSSKSINSEKLQLDRSGSNVSFGRIMDFAPIPTIFSLSFKLSVANNATSTTTAAYVYVGSGLDNIVTPDNNTSIYARFSINLTNINGQFSIRDIANASNSSNFSGEQNIRMVLNKSGSTLNYISPLNSMVTLAHDKMDIWVGNTLIFNEISILTASVNITDFKFLTRAGDATYTFDDIKIQSEAVNLPITLSKFEAKTTTNAVNIAWQTASETNNDYFEIEHSTTGKIFEKIGQQRGKGTTTDINHYTFEHKTPSVGVNYYRLKQVDFDEKFTYSPIMSAIFKGEAKKAKLYPNIVRDEVIVETYSDIPLDYRVFNSVGQVVKMGKVAHGEALNTEGVAQGLYFLKLSNQEVLKFYKQE